MIIYTLHFNKVLLHIYGLLPISSTSLSTAKDLPWTICWCCVCSTSIGAGWWWRYANSRWINSSNGSIWLHVISNMAGGTFGSMHSVSQREQTFGAPTRVGRCLPKALWSFAPAGKVELQTHVVHVNTQWVYADFIRFPWKPPWKSS